MSTPCPRGVGIGHLGRRHPADPEHCGLAASAQTPNPCTLEPAHLASRSGVPLRVCGRPSSLLVRIRADGIRPRQSLTAASHLGEAASPDAATFRALGDEDGSICILGGQFSPQRAALHLERTASARLRP